jgi:hypothetical protein
MAVAMVLLVFSVLTQGNAMLFSGTLTDIRNVRKVQVYITILARLAEQYI